jgi:alpha-amylase/alpha-mannosidase (GH57 family)
MTYPLHVALVWHMHQPYYRDLSGGALSLPWVRLHAAKDYLHMLEVLADFPDVHCTFNLVPSLVEQLDLYARGEAVDRCLQVSRQTSWTDEDRQLMLSFFFNANWNKVIEPNPAYNRLLQLRQQAGGRVGLFSDQYYRDLIAWFNLVWIDPNWRERDPQLAALTAKAEGFTAEDIAVILEKQMEIIRRTLPAYRQAAERGQIEISTSPYYHPILPLLISSETARRPSPGLPLPSPIFAHPEDADEQIRRAVELHQRYFGARPAGLWPSEGAVCPEIIGMLARNGFRWLASDETILARSLGVTIERDENSHVCNPTVLYQPYVADSMPNAPAILFRDHLLSDRIGFVYQHMDGNDAADDLMLRLYAIRERLGRDAPYLVSIILDGENCWEEYQHNGDKFLRRLYGRLSAEKDFRAVTVSEYLSQYPPRAAIDHLATGSWIAGNLETWIGEPAQNAAWEYLGRARDQLIAWQVESSLPDFETLEHAWEAIYVAEGSDWFWWYYSRNNPTVEGLFDQEFRRRLEQVYLCLGLPAPAWLRTPILVEAQAEARRRMPAGAIHPTLAASESAKGWERAGYVDPTPAGGVMQKAQTALRRLYFGSNETDLVLRLESNEDFGARPVSIYLSLLDGERSNRRPRGYDASAGLELPPIGLDWEIRLSPDEASLYRSAGQEIWTFARALDAAGRGPRVREVSVPYRVLGLEAGCAVGLFAVLYQGPAALEALPSSGYVSFLIGA